MASPRYNCREGEREGRRCLMGFMRTSLSGRTDHLPGYYCVALMLTGGEVLVRAAPEQLQLKSTIQENATEYTIEGLN